MMRSDEFPNCRLQLGDAAVDSASQLLVRELGEPGRERLGISPSAMRGPVGRCSESSGISMGVSEALPIASFLDTH